MLAGVVKLLKSGEIAFTQPGPHRGVQLKDLLEYQQRIRRRTRRELEAMRPQRTTRTDTSTAYGDSLKLCRRSVSWWTHAYFCQRMHTLRPRPLREVHSARPLPLWSHMSPSFLGIFGRQQYFADWLSGVSAGRGRHDLGLEQCWIGQDN
jgi:hypothetical protein